MITFSHLKCPSCRLLFSFQNTPKILKNCQHTICINCIKFQSCCPIDGKQININKWGLKSFLTNTEILENIQNEGNFTVQKSLGERFSFSGRKFQNEQTYNQKYQNCSGWQICKVHSQKASFICKSDSKIICSSCLTGGQHKQCKIISYEELLKMFTNYTDSTYKIYENVKVKFQNIKKSKVDQYIETELTKNKQKQIFQIRSFVQTLIEKLRKQQKYLIQNLETSAKQSIGNLQQNVQVYEYQNKKQLWIQQVHKLTSIMQKVYEWQCFEEALSYLNQSNNNNSLISQGQNLIKQFINMQQVLKNVVQQQFRKPKILFDENLIKNVEKICVKKQKQPFIFKNLRNYQTQTLRKLSLNKLFYLEFKPQISDSKISQTKSLKQLASYHISQQEDFLLDNSKEYQQNQTLTKNQITFQQNFSLVQGNYQKEPFTPILRKQQDSIEGLQESTIINFKNIKQRENLQRVQSSDITIDFKQIRRQSLSKKQNDTDRYFEKTLSYRKQRSPLKNLPITNNSSSKSKKMYIPQKYTLNWQAAIQDRSQNIDLTGAQLGDTTILYLSLYLSQSKQIKSLKLIRNKITDEIITDLITAVKDSNIYSLNLSQNNITEKALDILQTIELGNLKSITLSLNKIVLRKVRDRIQKFKEKGITLTV